MLIATWHRSSQLRAGGMVIARSLGGVPVLPKDEDLKRKRLLNIVEEMAIAARIRKPAVYVLPDEPCINAFAAGHSPDEAAVAVTQGALDKLDRDQLQAVIGHEFSHILNGDMQINMRLTAWIFGLFVITDLASRIMNRSGGGKNAARIKLVAFGIFLAGSVGLIAGRLLQAAVSRRREHLADASSVQFTRNPQALQGAFIAMAATPEGSNLQHVSAVNIAHLFFASTEASWAKKLGTGWFSTHPPLEERVQALDSRVSPMKFRTLVSDERRKMATRAVEEAKAAEEAAKAAVAAKAAAAAAEAAAAHNRPPTYLDVPLDGLAHLMAPVVAAAASMPVNVPAAATSESTPPAEAPAPAPHETGVATALVRAAGNIALAETMPTAVRMIGGRPLPPDVLRNRLSQEQQAAITTFIAQVEKSSIAIQATFVATMLAAEPAKWRTQLTRLAPLLGIELLKETPGADCAYRRAAAGHASADIGGPARVARHHGARRPQAVARHCACLRTDGRHGRHVAFCGDARTREAPGQGGRSTTAGDAARSTRRLCASCTRRWRNPASGPASRVTMPIALASWVCCRPRMWSQYPEALITPAALDTALKALAQVHPTGKKSLSEGMGRVIAVGGQLTVPQVDLLRAACIVIDCAVPVLPVDVIFEDSEAAPPATQLSAR